MRIIRSFFPFLSQHNNQRNTEDSRTVLTVGNATVGDTDNMIGPDNLCELASDRCGWKKIVAACSAAER